MAQIQPVARPSSLTDLAYERLRAAILDGDFGPGAAVSVVAMSAALRMSRSPVRAAVERLTSDGLLTQSGSSSVVCALSKQDLLAALQVRAPLEGLAAELATPRIDGDQLSALNAVHRRFTEAVSSGDTRGARAADLEFHQRLQAVSGNSVLVEHLQRLQSRVVVATYAAAWGGSQDQAVREHGLILAAVKDRDAVAARDAASSHVWNARERADREWQG